MGSTALMKQGFAFSKAKIDAGLKAMEKEKDRSSIAIVVFPAVLINSKIVHAV